MKTISFLLAILTVSISPTICTGQITNSGFENWIDAGTHLNPEGWWTPNDSILTGSFFPVTRAADHYPASVGNYSLRLENNTALLPGWGALGITWTGDFSGNDNPVFPVPGHPTSLWGYYKFLPQNNDTMEIHIRLYYNGIDVSGGSFKTFGMRSEWTPFSLFFSDYIMADSARIMLSSCYDNDSPFPHGNSVLYIDNLNFDNHIVVGISEVEEENIISIHPNPASETLLITFEDHSSDGLSLEILNSVGQIMLTKSVSEFNGKLKLDISNFPEGIYFVRANANIPRHTVCTKKLIVIR